MIGVKIDKGVSTMTFAGSGLDAFRRACAHDWYCDNCAMYWENNGTCGNESLRLKRPPQSWCYVEEM